MPEFQLNGKIIVLAILLVLILTSTVVFINLPVVVFACDPRYGESMIGLQDRMALLVRGWRSSLLVLPYDVLADPLRLSEEIGNAASAKQVRAILFSPMATVACQGQDVKLSDMQALTIGIGAAGSKVPFDFLLVSATVDPVWLDVADLLKKQMDAGMLPVALLFDGDNPDSVAIAEAMLASLQPAVPTVVVQSGQLTTTLIYSHLQRLHALGVQTVAAPAARSLDGYAVDPIAVGLRWIVDGMYKNSIPSDALEAWTADDLVDSISPILGFKGQHADAGTVIELPMQRVVRSGR